MMIGTLELLPQRSRDVEAVHLRQAEIEDDEVGLLRARERQRHLRHCRRCVTLKPARSR